MGLINITPFWDVLQSHAFSACSAIRTGPMDCINLSRMHWVIWRCIKFVLLLVVIIDYFKKFGSRTVLSTHFKDQAQYNLPIWGGFGLLDNGQISYNPVRRTGEFGADKNMLFGLKGIYFGLSGLNQASLALETRPFGPGFSIATLQVEIQYRLKELLFELLKSGIDSGPAA